jgi:hypothetical protein
MDGINYFNMVTCGVHYGRARPPLGFCWTSHILRKEAASAAYAIKVRLTDIRYAGGLVHELHGHGVQVHRLHDAAYACRPLVLRLP